MKLHFFGFILALLIVIPSLSTHSAFYGICCPSTCPPGQEAKEISTDDCDCTCKEGDKVYTGTGNSVCCQGSKNVVTGEIDQTCCENAGGVYVASGGTMGEPAACCKSATSSKDIEGTLNSSCCKNAGGGIRNGKCCRQRVQGS